MFLWLGRGDGDETTVLSRSNRGGPNCHFVVAIADDDSGRISLQSSAVPGAHVAVNSKGKAFPSEVANGLDKQFQISEVSSNNKLLKQLQESQFEYDTAFTFAIDGNDSKDVKEEDFKEAFKMSSSKAPSVTAVDVEQAREKLKAVKEAAKKNVQEALEEKKEAVEQAKLVKQEAVAQAKLVKQEAKQQAILAKEEKKQVKEEKKIAIEEKK